MTTNWVGWMMSAIVLLLLFAAGALLANPVRLLITGKMAEAVVVGMASNIPTGLGTANGALRSPMVEFVTSTGERVRVSGRSYSASPSARVGDAVTVAYSPSQPRDAQLLLLREFGPAGLVLGFLGFVILLWISFILVSNDAAYADPFKLLPAVISRFRLNPFRFPLLFMLSAAILAGGPATYVLSRQALDLRFNGIKAVGHVTGTRWESARLSDGSLTAKGEFPVIAYVDPSGTAHTIRRSLARPWSRLRAGDAVEVVYPARRPDKGIVNTWDELYLLPLLLVSMLLAFLVLFRLVLSGTIRS